MNHFKKIILSILGSCLFLLTLAQSMGKVIEEAAVKSSILNKAVRYTVYLPADYDRSERTYPVVYLLHGFTDDNTGWLQFGEINRYADKAIAEGIIPPMIIVMPNGDSSFYINSYDGKEKYEDFFIREFMPSIEKTYRIKADKRYRGIAGLSMGGYGSLIYSLKYPQLFAAAAPLSAAVFDDSASYLRAVHRLNLLVSRTADAMDGFRLFGPIAEEEFGFGGPREPPRKIASGLEST